MRKHGWQLPYHPLQVVAVAVFLGLGFAFYVFFVPFVGKKLLQYVVMGVYTPLVACVFFLYIWCAATDPADPGVFKSKKYVGAKGKLKLLQSKETGSRDEQQVEGNAISSVNANMSDNAEALRKSCCNLIFIGLLFRWCILFCRGDSHDLSSEHQMSEESMFYCSLCEVEVRKYSKHCRVCDKCVDGFDHHCRWLNNCIGRKNYREFFALMVSALLLLIMQWSIGIPVLILCFLERARYSADIMSKLGSGFSLVPFVIVVASCTLLAMIATVPLAQLLFFHVLLMKKGLSTYDYIVALREQEQEQQDSGGGGGQQSPQMSQVSSFTGLSSASSFGAFHRGAWCTPPRLFVEDQFVVPPGSGMPPILTPKKITTEPTKKNAGTVKISPWTLARMDSEEVSKAAEQARRKSRTHQRIVKPVVNQQMVGQQDMDGGFSGDSGISWLAPISDDSNQRQLINIPAECRLARISASPSGTNSSDEGASATPTVFAPLQLEARSAFRANRAVVPAVGLVPFSSPDSSLDSPDLRPFRVSSGADETAAPSRAAVGQKSIQQLSRSTSDGYDASGGEDSDRVPSRIVHKPTNWSNVIFRSGRGSGLANALKPLDGRSN